MPTNSLSQAIAQVLEPRSQLGACTAFKLTALVGRGLYRLKLGRVRLVQSAGGTIYIKTRRRHSALLVGVGNAAVSLCHGELRGLRERDWLAWEPVIGAWAWPEGISSRVRVERRSLLCPALPGEPLAAILRSERSLGARMRAVEIAARELQRLQSSQMRFPDGGVRRWSHGDAHAKNVLVDLEQGRALWFDFETVHAARCSPRWRHADDLRALAYSCAATCCSREYADLVRTLARSVECPRLREELLRQSLELQRRARPFHLAQAPLGWAEHQSFGRALQAELESESVQEAERGHAPATHSGARGKYLSASASGPERGQRRP